MIEPQVLFFALAADALIGDPHGWPHFVRFLGWAIEKTEALLRRRFSGPAGLRLAGLILALAIVGGAGLGSWCLIAAAGALWAPLGWALAFFLSYQCLAAGQLHREAMAAARPLEQGDIRTARKKLAMIVSRETAHLDETSVRRAIIETIAENLNDGVIAPLFYLALLGPAGAVAYKAVNTLDSMVGYKNSRYKDLGMVCARLDDAAGYLPARLTGLLIVSAAWVLRFDARGAWRIMASQHGAHESPNAGWPETACAGALGIRLGGPGYYHGRLNEKAWLNHDGADPAAGDVRRTLRLMWAAAALAALLALLAAALAL